MAKAELPSPELLRQLLRYEPETGRLFWRERPASMFSDANGRRANGCAVFNSRFAGKEAFATVCQPTSNCHIRYRQGFVLGHHYSAHRVIIAMVTGQWPSQIVDHDNRDGEDNRWSNLRCASHSENSRNRRKPRTNTSGTVGVYWRRECRKWQASIFASGKNKHLGFFVNKEDAIAARHGAEAEHGYHPRHGK